MGSGTPPHHSHAHSGDGGGDLNPDSVATDQATVGATAGGTTTISWDRPEINKSATTVQVPQDEDTVQDALRKAPRRLAANYVIEVDEGGDYSAEDWVVPPVQSEDLFDAAEGGNSRLTVKRQGTTATLNPNSVFIIGGRGQGNVVFIHTYPVGINPWDDEDAVWATYGGGEPKLSQCGIGGAARTTGAVGVLSYQSTMKIEGAFDWGTDLVSIGGKTKQGGMIFMPTGVTVSGSVTDHAWEAPTGIIHHGRQGPTATNAFAADPQRNRGVVGHQLPMVDRSGNLFDAILATGSDTRYRDKNNTKRLLFGDNGVINFFDESANLTASIGDGGEVGLGTFANHPAANNGDIWYIDGTGTPTEGFYGQTSGGVVQLG